MVVELLEPGEQPGENERDELLLLRGMRTHCGGSRYGVKVGDGR
jgi:hypothetical protein